MGSCKINRNNIIPIVEKLQIIASKYNLELKIEKRRFNEFIDGYLIIRLPKQIGKRKFELSIYYQNVDYLDDTERIYFNIHMSLIADKSWASESKKETYKYKGSEILLDYLRYNYIVSKYVSNKKYYKDIYIEGDPKSKNLVDLLEPFFKNVEEVLEYYKSIGFI